MRAARRCQEKRLSAETKTLAEVNFDSNGWHGSNGLTNQTAGKWVWQGEGYSSEDKSGEG
jgi:hypothetical protein